MVAETSTSADKRATHGEPSYVWRAGQERRFQMVQRWASPAGQCVLDVGCGVGMYTAAFLRETPRVFGVEIERERGLEARERAAGVIQSPGEHLPFADATFDVVFSHEVLEHVTDDRVCAAEMVRVTRPGGRIIVFVPNRLYPFETHGMFWRGRYHFGNVPLINWLPTSLRNRLAPHVRGCSAQRAAICHLHPITAGEGERAPPVTILWGHGFRMSYGNVLDSTMQPVAHPPQTGVK